jgi:hypothetical protein
MASTQGLPLDIFVGETLAQYAKRQAEVKNPNPKDSIGSSKVPMHLWPMEATVLGTLGLLDGAGKYGRSNYLVAPVRASIYYDAAMRHLAKWFSGEETDEDSGIPHLGHVLACCAILVGAQAAGTLIDDRNVKNGFCEFLKQYTPHVKRLQEKHASQSPKHYTIKDNA